MLRSRRLAVTSIMVIIAALLLPVLPVGASQQPGLSVAFWRTWARTDRPVAEGRAARTWMWGPAPISNVLFEEYDEATDLSGDVVGVRWVQYFDKTRMEVTDDGADPVNSWYVTNGLLAKELITGQLQLGHNRFFQGPPAQVPVAGDLNDPNAPTYATFAPLMGYQPLPVGMTIIQTVDRNGTVGADQALARFGVTAAVNVRETNHTVASVFWDFMNARGTVYVDGTFREDRLFENPFYATGLPLTEAYWTTVLVGGAPKRVLVQVFERRVLTYTPDNPPGWRVEAGNVGLHYYQWRYGQLAQQPVTWDTGRPEDLPYLDAVAPTIVQLAAGLGPLDALLVRPAPENPSWRSEVERRLIFLQDCARAMREATPSPMLSGWHAQLMVGLELLEVGASKVRRGLDQRNVSLILEGYQQMDEGRAAILDALRVFPTLLAAGTSSDPHGAAVSGESGVTRTLPLRAGAWYADPVQA
ncbi:peptidase domain-containing protein [Thermomicrobium sp. CFH 73360]|uniref:peptidase domain-containing protein n=1 Tax=Thermomicrobium sp. CFH 73360 TaxID=2951987 RepID=UPI00207723D2|nr:peptidase domain-containing protein [Thermomicrobium sp. CFH 73360]MCM8746998.1 peptidase domain-containing protein [Thermomicrobium sp. CFH 73360]